MATKTKPSAKKTRKFDDVPMPKGSQILENTVCLNLTLHGVTTRRKVRRGAIQVDADKSFLHVSKDIVDSPELRALKAADQQMTRWLRRRALPSLFKKGVYLLPLKLVGEVDEMLEQHRKDRADALEDFLKTYPERVEDAKTRLKKLFNKADYPSVARLRAAFTVSSGYVTLTVPGTLQGISQELYTRERKRAEEQWNEAAQTIRDALRASMMKMVRKMVARLSDSEDGNRKRIVETGMARAEEFLDLFNARNLTEDTALADLVGQARQVLRGVDVEKLRENDELREQVRSSFEEIEQTLSTMVVAAPSRKVRLLEEEDEDDD